MASSIGTRIKVQIFGQSHADAIGVVIDGLPAGIPISLPKVEQFLARRAGGNASYSTARKEPDQPKIVSGLVNQMTCGAPLCAIFENKNQRSEDYEVTQTIPRPSHADYTANVKYGGYEDKSGGGQFSGRMTLPMCFAGAVCLQVLESRGIEIGAHIFSIGEVEDDAYDSVNLNASLLHQEDFPTLNTVSGRKMKALMDKTAGEGDSIGGVIECGVVGVPVGVGNPIFDNIESKISYGMFGIPAVKGIEFGCGFKAAQMKGSECNDAFCIRDNTVKCLTNNSGGIQGGIANGMPIVFRVAIKPTPSIYLEQQSVDLKTMSEVKLSVQGRHDSCIVVRAVPCVEAMAAIVLCDLLFDM